MLRPVLTLLIVFPVPAQEDLGARVDPLFERWDQDDSPGASIAVLHRGEVVFAEGYGLASLEQGTPITPDTIFHVASVSKQFTAFALCLLEADGVLSIDDDVRTHLPEVPDFGAPITLRHLLHHTSGLRDQWEALAIAGWRLDDVITTEHVLTLVANQRELNFPTGSAHLYCNTGYTLAGQVVARASGVSFPDFCSARIFEPLGMARTHFHDDHQHVVRGRADCYRRGEQGFERAVLSYANAGATSLFTTSRDLLRWLANMGDGAVGGAQVQATMRVPYVLNDGSKGAYALGLMHGLRKGRATLSHSGGDAGFRSFVVWFPEEQLGIAVLANLAEVPISALAYQVADMVLDGDEQPAPSQALPVARPGREAWPECQDIDLDTFSGRYWSEELGTFYDLRVEGDALVAVHRRHGVIPLRHYKDDSFRGARWFFGRLQFTRGDDGEVDGLRLSGGRVRNLRFERSALPVGSGDERR